MWIINNILLVNKFQFLNVIREIYLANMSYKYIEYVDQQIKKKANSNTQFNTVI
jgi:hypothetical protein